MNLQDRFIELILSIIDRVLNLVTFGAWSRWQGARKVNCQIKE